MSQQRVTLRQVEERARVLNNSELRATPWGVAVERSGDEIVVVQVPRKAGRERSEVFRGSPREVMAFFAGIQKGVIYGVALVRPPAT